ncbi:unnamed protein product [Rhizophagus irregularis]|nr:unnamed protein product [Rhizophagus irregularis]
MKDTSRQKVSFLICFLKVIKRPTFRPTKKLVTILHFINTIITRNIITLLILNAIKTGIGQSQELIIESQKVIENIVEIEIDGQDQVVMTIVKIEADGQEGLNTIGKLSSDYELSNNELARKYYKKKEKRNEDQLASLLQYDKVKGLFEEFLKNKLNEPSNTNHELEYLEGQDHTRSQSRTQEEDHDRTKGQIRTWEDWDHSRGQTRTQDQGHSRGQTRTREDQGHSRTKLAVRSQTRRQTAQNYSLRRNRFQRQAARDRSLRRIRSCTRSTSSSNLSHNDPKYIHINDLPQDLRNVVRQKETSFQDEQARRKHMNSKRNDKRINRANVIDHLKEINDPLVKMFKIKELLPIKSNSLYHSPEISETDDETPGQRKIVTRDLKWRSSTLQYFLRDYIDHIFSESSKVPKKRTRIHDSVNFYDKERTKPFQAPNWTISGYTGSLKMAVQKACIERSSNTLPARV